MAEFDPRQLDQLEDALEDLDDLEGLDGLQSLELGPALTERLAEYQQVLALCRDAFPQAEPRADLLADVIAEAHAVSRRPKFSPSEAGGSTWRRFWDRWRGTLVPGLALAGTTAAVLLVLEPSTHETATTLLDDESTQDKAAPQPDSTPTEPASEPRVDPNETPDTGPGPTAVEAMDSGSPDTDGSNNAAGASTERDPDPVRVPDKRKTSISKSSAPDPGMAVEPSTPITPLTKDETWTALDRANADRRKGDCDRARSRYEDIIDAGSDSLAVARAKAGIGLCLEQDRRSSEANQWFSKAREGNAGIDAWIEDQRDEQPLPGETKKSKKASKPAAAQDSL